MKKLELQFYNKYLPPRPRDAHKGMFGHVLVIGGDLGFVGAVRLAAEGALRVGAGLVSIATRPDHATFIAITRPEIMSHGITTPMQLKKLISQATVICIGPGLGQSKWAKNLFDEVLQTKLPIIVDADALNLLAKQPRKRNNWILTPHPGEAARLLMVDSQDVQTDRRESIKNIQNKYTGVCVLKGADTLVLSVNKELYQCVQGNPGMATPGMGDLLSGVIAGLVAQSLSLSNAAALGVILHASAADLAAKKGERGMIASDLLPFIRQLVNSFK